MSSSRRTRSARPPRKAPGVPPPPAIEPDRAPAGEAAPATPPSAEPPAAAPPPPAIQRGTTPQPRRAAPGDPRHPELRGLNREQLEAVTTTEGPLLVLAGAGSGKTRVITHRIAHLLARGVDPRNVLAMTFTNKAAGEMRERASELVGREAARALTVGTFHSFSARVLRAHAGELGLVPHFGICDDGDQLAAVKGALRELRIPEATLHPRVVLSRMSLAKNKMVTCEEYESAAADDYDALVARAWQRYDERLRRTQTVDFDGLLLLLVKLLSEHAEVRGALRHRFRYVLVDEYQDTNRPQYEIVRRIAEGHRNLCVVGDDDQSIYGWRGADIRKILDFARDFPGAAVIRLETNYRSTNQILKVANSVIRNNAGRHEKTLRSGVGDGPPVRIAELIDEEAEADFVVQDFLREVRAHRERLSDTAILFRTQVQPRAFEACLRANRVPYVLVGGQSFFDRKEVRDVLAFLKLMANPDDEQSLLRIVNVPPRGVGDATVDRLLAFAAREGISAAAAFERAGSVPGCPPAAIEAVRALRRTLAALSEKAAGTGLPEAVRELVRAIDYRAEIDRAYPEAAAREARWAAVEEVVNFAENYARRAGEPTLTGFLEEVTLSAEDRQDRADRPGASREAVTLMTLHAAKGLEFPRVYLVGVEEDLLPHRRSIEEDTVDEERRLFYVGVTRARRHLAISLVHTRAKYGKRIRCRKSRFIHEIKGEAFTPPRASGAGPAPAPLEGGDAGR
jgi:ATP-dependent DNA helicase UvrD/PcrA